MAYVLGIILLVIFYIIGEAIRSIFTIEKLRHSLVYGFLGFIAIFFAVTAPLVIINVSWISYFWIMTIVSIFVIGLSLSIYVKRKLYKEANVFNYLLSNWHVLLISLIFFIFFMTSTGTEFIYIGGYGPSSVSIDSHIYFSKAVQGIDRANIFMTNHDPLWFDKPMTLTGLTNYWEYFWAYGASVFNIPIASFVHTTIPVFIYPVAIATLDELLYLPTAKNNKYGKYALFSILILLVFNNTQGELVKFMLYPWFGNVFSTVLFIPLMLIFLYHSLSNSRMKWFLIVLPFVALGITPAMPFYVMVFYPIVILIWVKYRKIKVKSDILFLVLLSVGTIGCILGAGLIGRLTFWRTFLDIVSFSNAGNVLERDIFRFLFNARLPFFFASIVYFFKRNRENKIGVIEKIFVGYFIFVITFSIIPVISIIPFNLFNFAYTRIMQSILFLAIPYGTLIFLENARKQNWKMTSLLTLVILLSLNLHHGILIKEWPGFFKIDNMLSQTRLNPVAEELGNTLRGIEGDKNVCVSPSLIPISKIDEYKHFDVGLALMATNSRSFLTNCFDGETQTFNLNNTDVFILINEENKELVEENKNLKYLSTIEDEHIRLDIYEVENRGAYV